MLLSKAKSKNLIAQAVKLLKITALTGALTVLRMVSGFIIAKLVAIFSGPSGIVLLGQTQSLVSVLNGIVNAPAGNAVIRYTAENHAAGIDACAVWWRAALKWSLLLLALVLPVTFIFAEKIAYLIFDQRKFSWVIYLTSIFLPLSVANTLVNSVTNGRQEYKRFVLIGIIAILCSTAITITLIYCYPVFGALIGTAVWFGISGLAMLILSINQPWFRIQYWFGKVKRDHIKAISGYVLMTVTSVAAVPISLIVIRNLLVEAVGWNQAGQWQAVWKISEVYLGVITMTLSTYYLPRLSSLGSIELIKNEIKGTAKIIMPVIIIMGGIIYLLRDTVIAILFTEEFHASRDLFAVQLTGDVVKILSWLYAYPMISRGAVRWFVSTELIFSGTFVLFSWIAIKHLGLQGMPVAYLINYLIYFLFIFTNLKHFSR